MNIDFNAGTRVVIIMRGVPGAGKSTSANARRYMLGQYLLS
jgi:adenylylsulfate kinase-like enzyme